MVNHRITARIATLPTVLLVLARVGAGVSGVRISLDACALGL
jgi:hypothetical protein